MYNSNLLMYGPKCSAAINIRTDSYSTATFKPGFDYPSSIYIKRGKIFKYY